MCVEFATLEYTERRVIPFPSRSDLMEYDRDDTFPFDFEPNGIQSGSELKIKLSPRSYSIQFRNKWKSIFLS